jgi:hypothetical protein
MHLRLPVVLLSAFALAAPGAMAYGKDKDDKDKDKNKGRKEQKSDDRRDRDDDRRDRDDDRDDRDRRDGDRADKMTICHIPPGNRSARHTIRIGESAWAAHRAHGDHRGTCGRRGTNRDGRFDELDVNDDGVISLREWRGDRATFDRLDRNDDGVISRNEFSR